MDGNCSAQTSAHIHGNYHKYYSFHSADTRSKFFKERNFFRRLWASQGCPDHFRILDVGCNEGNLSFEMLRQAEIELVEVKCSLLGIDIDPSLIALAKAKATHIKGDEKANIKFIALDFMDTEATCSLMHQYFQLYQASDKVFGFNLVCLFSVTMWIHLNHGDSGLVNFLSRSASLLIPRNDSKGNIESVGKTKEIGGGSLIVEAQPWKCYKSAHKRDKKIGIVRPPNFQVGNLSIRGDSNGDMAQRLVEILSVSFAADKSTMPISDSAITTDESKRERKELRRQEWLAKVAGSKELTVLSKNKADKKSLKKIQQPASGIKDTTVDIRYKLRLMPSFWDLGQEDWGRNILIFHNYMEQPSPPLRC